MSDRRTFEREVGLQLIELRHATIAHCAALRQVIDLLNKGNAVAAIARLDGAVMALEQVCRGQVVRVTMPCPDCGAEQDVEAWVDRRRCGACGLDLVWPEEA